VIDLAVIGGGVAGLVAARRGQQLGRRVVVLDKADGHGPGGNSRLSGGRVHAAYMDPHRPPGDLYDAIMAKTDGVARPDVAEAWARNAGRAIDFLVAEGARFARGEPEYLWHQLQPGRPADREGAFALDEWRGRGPDLLLRRMRASVERAGGSFVSGARARELLTAGGRVAGVRYERAGMVESLAADATLMADGGFQANAELVHRYITAHYRLRGGGEDTGDCLQMGLTRGAQPYAMDAFYGHTVVRDDGDPRINPFPMPVLLIDSAVVVDGHGRRIADESLGPEDHSVIDDAIATDIAKCDTPGACWLIFDERLWQTVGRETRPGAAFPLNPILLEEGGHLTTAPTAEALAAEIGVPAVELTSTLDAYNAFCRGGPGLDPHRSRPGKPIETGPFHALPLVVGIMFAMGGLLVDGQARVLGGDERPLPGLYAAGGTMAGLQGGPRNGYTGGWTEAMTFGLLAAESIRGAT
jgi:fumarate reductase flavoprotein subunit